MPILDLRDWPANPAATRIKILSLMMYSKNYSPPYPSPLYESQYRESKLTLLLTKMTSNAPVEWSESSKGFVFKANCYETEDGEIFYEMNKMNTSNPFDLDYQTEWSRAADVDLSNVPEVRCGLEAGWILWTARRLQETDAHVNSINKATYVLKRIWEEHNPGRVISQEAILRKWQNLQHVAHLWAAYYCLRYHNHGESHLYSRFDLSFLENNFPEFLAQAELLRKFGEEQHLLSPADTWAVPKKFPRPDVAIDMMPLTDEENDYLAEYHSVFCESEPQNGSISEQAGREGFIYSPDFRLVKLRGKEYELSIQQAQVVEILWEAYQNGIPSLTKSEILTKLGKPASGRLDDTFRRKSDWKELIHTNKGRWRLNL